MTAFGDRPRTALIAVAAGTGLGIASQLVVRLPNPLGLLGTLAGPWLATAFAVGAVARSRRSAWWAGAASMAAAIAAYYVLRWVINLAVAGGVTVRGQAIPYLVLGLVAGAGMGLLGALWRTGTIRWKVLGPGLLAGALGAEVIVLSTRAWRGEDLLLAVVQGAAAGSSSPRISRDGSSAESCSITRSSTPRGAPSVVRGRVMMCAFDLARWRPAVERIGVTA